MGNTPAPFLAVTVFHTTPVLEHTQTEYAVTFAGSHIQQGDKDFQRSFILVIWAQRI